VGRLRLDGEDLDFKSIGDERARIRPPSKKRVIMRPGDQRGFIHKKILGGIGSLAGVLPIPGGGLISTAARFLGGRGGQVQPVRPRTGRTAPRTETARVSVFSRAEKELGRFLKFGGGEPAPLGFGGGGGGVLRARGNGDGCFIPGQRVDPRTGRCKFFIGGESGRDRDVVGVGDFGQAVMGRFGAGMVPASMTIERAVCDRGMQLGIDGLCYNKGQITNKQRMWPRGRRPLLTGGDMRAIGVSARAGAKLERTTARLRALGLMKPLPRARKTHQHAKKATGVVNV